MIRVCYMLINLYRAVVFVFMLLNRYVLWYYEMQ